MNQKITEDHRRRRAIVYVRQSTPIQLLQNRESQLRQYGLAEHARKLGFRDIETIDADLGRSGSGLEERPGFQRLVTEVCSGQVGAVLCIEASRLARNGRDWHQLFELCGLVGALVIEPDGVYDPRLINDRLLLGLKGIMNEFELSLMRQRSVAAIWQKARRGELQCRIPVGFCWTEDGRIELNPDRRVQQAVRHIFYKFAELGSVHQVFLSFREDGILVPFARVDRPGETVLNGSRRATGACTRCWATQSMREPTCTGSRNHEQSSSTGKPGERRTIQSRVNSGRFVCGSVPDMNPD